MAASNPAWEKIFEKYNIHSHDFKTGPFYISAKEIKQATREFVETRDREPRILCKQDSRDDRPTVFKNNDVFILPVKNGYYAIIKGEGYIDIPEINTPVIEYESKLNFHLDTAVIGNSEMQHLDMAYASSIIRTFMEDPSLVLTIRGRKYTPDFNFFVNEQNVSVSSVQTEVDAGYEGKDSVVLVEAKSSGSKNSIIRQMFYPYRQWTESTSKTVTTIFFERDIRKDTYNIWQFAFKDENDYNSIFLEKSARYKMLHKNFEEKLQIDS